ncbi:MAG: GNAT family N-acetyltransferase [Thermodesulfobacteriota bacterium]|nr:GNAT family N-acetyltransferase [Thermodesulfobacteriota bacterium]
MKNYKEKTENECEKFTIREMELNDVDEVLPIANTSLLNPWSKKMFLEEVALPYSHCFLIRGENDRNKDIPLGFICFRNIGEESELLNICIHPRHRQKGLAKILMEFYIDFCSKKGVKNYYLEVHPLNIPAVHLYRSFDFQPAGKRKNFYQGEYDALLMER